MKELKQGLSFCKRLAEINIRLHNKYNKDWNIFNEVITCSGSFDKNLILGMMDYEVFWLS